jgi:phospho-N-acetylmuramoyl-pentapeptide-transferase
MLFNLLTSLIDQYSFLNVFKYLTFRTGLSVVTSLIVVFIVGGPLIKLFSEKMITGPIRQDGPIDHIIKKSGTPTMGGVIIIIGILSSTFLWADLTNIYVWTLIFVCLALGALGLLDDILKIKFKNSRGLKSRYKFLGQIIISSITLFILVNFSEHEYLLNLYFPFFKNFIWYMGLFFIPFGLFVIIGASNAVNLTDGLDGLATVPVMLVALSFTLISYVVGNTIFSEYLQIQYIPDVGELSIFCGSVVGACLGFLWYNAPPAKIFMGDTGSLSLGGSLAAIAIIVKHEIVLAIIGGLFVLETVSVIIQVASFKLTGKRIFKMAPIHHHFEKKGWAESTIVIRFWIIAIILALIGLATLKLR